MAGTREDILRTYALVYSNVGNRPDAEELTAEVFARLRRSEGGAAGGANGGEKIDETTRAVLADHWRRHFGAEGPAAGAAGPNEPGRRAEVVLAGLPADHRTLLELRFWRGCSMEELARRMGLSAHDATRLQLEALRSAAALDHPARGPGVPAGGTRAAGA